MTSSPSSEISSDLVLVIFKESLYSCEFLAALRFPKNENLEEEDAATADAGLVPVGVEEDGVVAADDNDDNPLPPLRLLLPLPAMIGFPQPRGR